MVIFLCSLRVIRFSWHLLLRFLECSKLQSPEAVELLGYTYTGYHVQYFERFLQSVVNAMWRGETSVTCEAAPEKRNNFI